MSLQAILTVPEMTRGSLLNWSFSHARNHQDIVQAVLRQKNIAITDYILDPIVPERLESWLFRHQQAHNEFNSALGLPGDDFDVNVFDKPDELRSWIYQHFKEHEAASYALNIG